MDYVGVARRSIVAVFLSLVVTGCDPEDGILPGIDDLQPDGGTPPASPIAVPGAVEAENFDGGGEGEGYHDAVTGNAGGRYRPGEDVDIVETADPLGGLYDITDFESGEWLAYTIDVARTGAYDIALRLSSAVSNSAFHIEVDGVDVSGRVVVPNTGGWSEYQWLAVPAVSLSAGQQRMKIVSDQQYFNLNTIRATATPVASPYPGTTLAVPGMIEAEHFDAGGEGGGYHDTTAGNQGDAQFRAADSVDLFVADDPAGGDYIVKNFEAGEWLSYTLDVTRGGNYDLDFRAATHADFPASALRVEVDGIDLTGTVILPDTGGWTSYDWVGRRTISLGAGRHVLRIVAERAYFALNAIRLSEAVPVPPADPNALEFFCTFLSSPSECGFGEQSKVPGRASIVNVALDGGTAVRLHTEPGDDNVYGSGANERNDLASDQAASGCYEGNEQWWAHSVLFPDDYVVPPAGAVWNWGIIADFHHTGPTGQANFQIVSTPTGLVFQGFGGDQVANSPADPGYFGAVIGPVVKNVWYNFVYHVNWSSGNDGFFRAWVNGAQVLDHRGPTLYAGQGCYFKLANYHTPIGQPVSVIHDRVLRGRTPLAVSVGPLQGVLDLVDGVLTPLLP